MWTRAPSETGTGRRCRPEQAKLLFGGPEAPLDVRPGASILWAALLFASVFRQSGTGAGEAFSPSRAGARRWSYTVLSQLYALSPDDYGNYVSVRGATGLTSDEYADIVYAYTVVAVASMGVSGACATLFGARRTAAAGLVFQAPRRRPPPSPSPTAYAQVVGCVACALAYGVAQLAVGTVVQAAGFGIFLTPAYSLVFGIERSGKRRVLATTTVQARAHQRSTLRARMGVFMPEWVSSCA